MNKNSKIKTGIRRVILFALVTVMIYSLALGASAAEGNAKKDSAAVIAQTVVALPSLGELTELEEYIRQGLENDNNNTDWMLLAISRAGYDTTELARMYLETLDSRLEGAADIDRLRLSLVCTALGIREDTVADTLNTVSPEEDSSKSIMVSIWWMILHDAQSADKVSALSEKYAAVAQKLMSEAHEDGSFALLPTLEGDVDVTAMTVIALSNLYREKNAAAVETVTSALDWLATKQKDDGSFEGFMGGCAESTAQVVLMMHTLGDESFDTDLFKKGDITPLSSLQNYAASDIPELFANSANSRANEYSTAQALSAYVSDYRKNAGASPYFDISGRYSRVELAPPLEGAADSGESTEAVTLEETDAESAVLSGSGNGLIYKLLIIAVILLIALIASISTIMRIKKNRRPLRQALIAAVIFALALAASVGVMRLDIQTPDDYYSNPDAPTTGDTIEVTLKIICDNAPDDMLDGLDAKKQLPVELKLTLAEGSSVYDALVSACRTNGIRMESSSSGRGRYIEGIAGLYEKACGDTSGWMFYVNGLSASSSCSDITLSDGDVILWGYTLDMGTDLIDDAEKDTP